MRQLFIAALLLAASPVHAITIGAPIVEDFEGYQPGPNILQHPDLGSFLIPGIQSPFTFGSGVTMTRPIPNPGSRNGGFPEVQGVVLGDWSRNAFQPNGAPFCIEIDCVLANHVPSGSAYLAYGGLKSTGPVEFSFSEAVGLVGGYVTGATPIKLTAFDSDGVILSTATIDPVYANDWRYNFLGVIDGAGIRSVWFEGDFFVLDDLTFVPLQVSEPASYLLLISAALGLAAMRGLRIADHLILSPSMSRLASLRYSK